MAAGYLSTAFHRVEVAQAVDPVLPLRVRDFLLTAGRFDAARLNHVLEEVQMAHLLASAVQTLSGGEFQRVLLARALLHQPERVEALLKRLKERGVPLSAFVVGELLETADFRIDYAAEFSRN